jgi:hypothetical protein
MTWVERWGCKGAGSGHCARRPRHPGTRPYWPCTKRCQPNPWGHLNAVHSPLGVRDAKVQNAVNVHHHVVERDYLRWGGGGTTKTCKQLTHPGHPHTLAPITQGVHPRTVWELQSMTCSRISIRSVQILTCATGVCTGTGQTEGASVRNGYRADRLSPQPPVPNTHNPSGPTPRGVHIPRRSGSCTASAPGAGCPRRG